MGSLLRRCSPVVHSSLPTLRCLPLLCMHNRHTIAVIMTTLTVPFMVHVSVDNVIRGG
jgi:hypothetical protein